MESAEGKSPDGHDAPTAEVIERLVAAGCVAAAEEAAELIIAGTGDPARLEDLIRRREAGEPLAWVTGSVQFGPVRLAIQPGVYVPRHQSLILVEAAVEILPADGLAVDLCTGSGAVARCLQHARPGARVIGTDIDPVACRCAEANGVEVYLGDLDAPLPAGLYGTVDVVTAVAPYVPTAALPFLPRDARDQEPEWTHHGGASGLKVSYRVVDAAGRLLHRGGVLVLELGGDQDAELRPRLDTTGFDPRTFERFTDEDGDLRAVRAALL